jgi:ribosomal protein S20
MFKKLIAGAVTAAVLGAGGLAVAGATGNSDSPTTTAPSTDASAKAAGHGVRAIRGAAKVAADTIGVSVADLQTAVKDGKTVAEVATAHNVTPQTVVTAIVTAANKRIDAAVTAGKLSTERATKLKARVPKFADAFVNHTKASVHRSRHRRAAGATLQDAASFIGVTVEGLRGDLAKGESIADVATAHGKDVTALEAKLVSDASTLLDKAVAAGKLKAEAATRIKARLPQRIDRLVHHQFKGADAKTTATASA